MPGWRSRRLEHRWRQTFERTRARTEVRVNLTPPGWRLMPFLQAGVALRPHGHAREQPREFPPTPGLNQVRGFVGVGLQVASNVRLDVGFLMRSRPVPAVVPGTFDPALDEGLWLQLFVDVPGAGR